MLKFVCVASVLLIATCQLLEAAPSGGPHKALADMSQTELVSKFEQFLYEDKQAMEIRSAYEKEIEGSASHHLRKRQSEMNDFGGMTTIRTDLDKADGGFLDRAAKFVLELVQRFLKWINTD